PQHTYTSRNPLHSLHFSFTPSPPTQSYTLSLHDALPISFDASFLPVRRGAAASSPLTERSRERPASTRSSVHWRQPRSASGHTTDRKSTRLNSSHVSISYAVFCLKKKIHAASRSTTGPSQ